MSNVDTSMIDLSVFAEITQTLNDITNYADIVIVMLPVWYILIFATALITMFSLMYSLECGDFQPLGVLLLTFLLLGGSKLAAPDHDGFESKLADRIVSLEQKYQQELSKIEDKQSYLGRRLEQTKQKVESIGNIKTFN